MRRIRKGMDLDSGSKNKSSSDRTLTYEKSCVQKLYNALRAADKLKKHTKVSIWHKEFTLLGNDQDKGTITDVLNWYCSMIGQEYIPHAYSAKSFRTKFAQLKDIMENDPRSTTPGKEARTITKKVKMYNWPRGIDQFLPAIIQRSLDNYAPFYKEVIQLKTTLNGMELKLLIYLMEIRFLTAPRYFVERWMMYIQEDVERGYYQGSPMSMSWKRHSKRFHIMGRDKTYQWCAKSYLWDDIFNTAKVVHVCNEEINNAKD